jgi:hypothetical protein
MTHGTRAQRSAVERASALPVLLPSARVRIREPRVQVAMLAVAWSSPVPRCLRIAKPLAKPVSRGYASACIRS